ncbi:peptidoglycan DD-metalloendopeptidase family protein [Shouchella shacheensis]|uniref:peptidoglycan DD-metalloendopeptidase family protein n=1 Tax=Shouchella shacheensis TaxID=1649580 RepID=UPI00074009D3|nr:M23 family metallopeptidase [Shouchella shacheensis]
MTGIVDFAKRMVIALILAGFIGLLFMGAIKTSAEEKEKAIPEEMTWPTGGTITDTYGTRDASHFGIDIGAAKGTPVVSALAGTVSRSYTSDTYGETVFVLHPNGYETVYAHLDVRFVEEGQAVDQGTMLGTVGNSGHSFGDHLHFEVHKGRWNIEKSESVDPLAFLEEDQLPTYTAFMDKHEVRPANASMHAEEHETVTVAPGDTVYQLSRENEVAVEELIAWNNLDAQATIVTGETLRLYPPS